MPQGLWVRVPLPVPKRKDFLSEVLSFWVPPPRGRLHPSVFQMLGASELPLRRGFASGKTLVRRKGAAGQKAGLPVLQLLSRSLKISILTALCTSEQSPLCSDVFLCPWQKRRHPPAPLLLLSKSNPLRWASIWYWVQIRKFRHLYCFDIPRHRGRHIVRGDFFAKALQSSVIRR